MNWLLQAWQNYTKNIPPDQMHLLVLLSVLAAALLAAKLAGELSERIGQPTVLGELMAGLLLGPSVLNLISTQGDTGHSMMLFAEIGAIFLLFEIGMETDIGDLMKVGKHAIIVACVGVAVPMILGFITAYLMLPKSSGLLIQSLFIGATLAATSVGITARVLADLGILKRVESQIILAAAVVDDVIGLIILAVVSGIATDGSVSVVSIVKIIVIAGVFLGGSIWLGLLFGPKLGKNIRRMQVRAAYTSFVVISLFIMAAAAQLAGLAVIIGAFAAGLVFNQSSQNHMVQERLSAVGDIFTPIFFVMMGAQMDLRSLAKADGILWLTLALIIVAVLGKLACCLPLIRSKMQILIVGVGMIPRGEVGIIFATIGIKTGAFDHALYTAILILVMVTTLITPVWLKKLSTASPTKSIA